MYADYHLWIYFVVSLELYTFIIAMGVVTNCSELIHKLEKKAPNFIYSRINIITRKSHNPPIIWGVIQCLITLIHLPVLSVSTNKVTVRATNKST